MTFQFSMVLISGIVSLKRSDNSLLNFHCGYMSQYLGYSYSNVCTTLKGTWKVTHRVKGNSLMREVSSEYPKWICRIRRSYFSSHRQAAAKQAASCEGLRWRAWQQQQCRRHGQGKSVFSCGWDI